MAGGGANNAGGAFGLGGGAQPQQATNPYTNPAAIRPSGGMQPTQNLTSTFRPQTPNVGLGSFAQRANPLQQQQLQFMGDRLSGNPQPQLSPLQQQVQQRLPQFNPQQLQFMSDRISANPQLQQQAFAQQQLDRPVPQPSQQQLQFLSSQRPQINSQAQSLLSANPQFDNMQPPPMPEYVRTFQQSPEFQQFDQQNQQLQQQWMQNPVNQQFERQMSQAPDNATRQQLIQQFQQSPEFQKFQQQNQQLQQQFQQNPAFQQFRQQQQNDPFLNQFHQAQVFPVNPYGPRTQGPGDGGAPRVVQPAGGVAGLHENMRRNEERNRDKRFNVANAMGSSGAIR